MVAKNRNAAGAKRITGLAKAGRPAVVPSVYAWAAVSRKTGKVLRGWDGHYGIYTYRIDAQNDCPKYGQVRRVRISVCAIKEPK